MKSTSRESAQIPAPSLWDSFFAGNRRACARLITLIENDPRLVPTVRDRLMPKLGKAVRIGITGPPGVGKSTLTATVALGLADQEHRIGVVAVDPSSPFTGGAFMGDRVRMEKLVGDHRIFLRSLASREGHGGLSPATPYVADVLEGFGMDRILIETVGVGQAELDVMSCVDIVVLVLQPSTGDAIQTLKAGIIEAADLIVVNKADLPGVETVLQSLRFLFSLGGPRPHKPIPPVLRVSAQNKEGIDKLVAEIERQAEALVESGRHDELRQERMEREIRERIQQHLWRQVEELTGAEAEIRTKAEELVKSGESPYTYVRDACSKIEISRRTAKKHGRKDD
ncbi:MAG: methylmalonyl Co-A mutase-associated GTPase MeaB [Fimbriimonadaceae bacterium]|nr:methylmalonyl Co-A mutase-associated GTPase MeaB [Fimbriimonadaceae bacterium]